MGHPAGQSGKLTQGFTYTRSALDLSQRRANSVMRALIERGVQPERLKAVGYGETRPIADNKKASGRAQNRRVELKIEEQD